MADTDELLDQQIHDAFERIELSEEAQDRMLAKLLEAQGERAVAMGEPQPATSQEADSSIDVVPFTPRRPWHRVVLPLAAVLVAALVVVRIGMGLGAGSSQAASDAGVEFAATASEDKALAEGGVSLDTTNGSTVDAPDVAEEAVPEALMLDAAPEAAMEELGSVDLCPLITLADGTRLTALVDGLYTVEVDAEEVGDPVGEATARPFDSDEGVACTVYRMAGSDGFAVQYEGESSFWQCVAIDETL